MTKSRLQTRALSLDEKRALQPAAYRGLQTQWTSRTLRTAGHDIIFVAVYMAPGEGLQGTNYLTLLELGMYLRAQGQPLSEAISKWSWRSSSLSTCPAS